MKRTTGSQELLLTLTRGKGTSLQAQIEQQLRESIGAGRLPPGMSLPSTRVLASELDISRGVVVEAFAQLIAEGYLVARLGSATCVADNARARIAERTTERQETRFRYDFRPGVPALSTFPRQEWLASIRKALKESPHVALGYGDPRGLRSLREVLAGYLGRVRGVLADPGKMVVSNGFAQGLRLVCTVLRARGGHRVAMENPSHVGQRSIVLRAGLEPVPVAMDEGGLRVDQLEAMSADAVIVTPAHQFPTGVVLAPDRRVPLVSWATRNDALVIEDDYDAEYRYDRMPVGAVQGLDPEHVVYVGSASKTLAPGLRLAWLVLPSDVAGDVAEAKANDDLGSPIFEQMAFAEFVSDGKLDLHLRRNRKLYRSRRDALVEALAEHVPEAEIGGIAAGLHLVAWLPKGASEDRIVEAAARESVGIYSLGAHRFPGTTGPPALLLGYPGLSERAIATGIKRLRHALDKL